MNGCVRLREKNAPVFALLIIRTLLTVYLHCSQLLYFLDFAQQYYTVNVSSTLKKTHNRNSSWQMYCNSPIPFNSHDVFVVRVPWLSHSNKIFTKWSFPYIIVNVVSSYTKCPLVLFNCLVVPDHISHFHLISRGSIFILTSLTKAEPLQNFIWEIFHCGKFLRSQYLTHPRRPVIGAALRRTNNSSSCDPKPDCDQI